jgi:glycosyltransferase involved in cell wall biosynthesis
MTSQPSISTFFPCYNDAGTIASMVLTAKLTLETITDDYEIIVVDDGSQDHSRDILRELAKKYDCVRLVFHDRNRGYGGALRSGFATAAKEFIFYTDGDAQYDPRELRLLVQALQADESLDLVNGYKIGRSDPLHRIIIGWIYQVIIKQVFRLRLRDVDCDFRLIRRSVFDRVALDFDSGVICVELMKKVQDAGFGLAEVPVHHYHRAYGRSQFFRFGRLVRVARDLSRLWWRLVVRHEHRTPQSVTLESGESRVPVKTPDRDQ